MKTNLTKTLRFLSFSFISFFAINAIAQVPVANFKSCKRVLEVYDIVEMEDLSTNTPLMWEWSVLDSKGADALNSGDVIADPLLFGRGRFSKNPQFQFDLPGCYTVTLKASNMTGPSAIESKTCYIEVVEISTVYLGYGTYGPKGDNQIYNEDGSILDDGGHDLNYSNNQGLNTRSFIKITPSNGRNISLQFYQLRLSNTGDSLSIYDADTVVAGKRLAVLTSANNGQSPVFNTTGSKMYIIFKTNGTGSDSGFYGVFYTVNNPLLPISKQIKVVRNTATLPSVFVNDNPTILARNYVREWYVNDTLQPAYTDKDTLVHTFYNTNAYKVCIKLTSCDTTINNCIQGNNNLSLHTEALSINSVYPNPFTHSIKIQNVENASVQVIDVLGKVVYNMNVEANAELDLHSLDAGIYTLLIQSDFGNKSIKLIKN
jgi:PKD repeat protein